MPESFDCPKCGAPIKYNAVEQGFAETITCSYCGESIVIPPEMRRQPPAAHPARHANANSPSSGFNGPENAEHNRPDRENAGPGETKPGPNSTVYENDWRKVMNNARHESAENRQGVNSGYNAVGYDHDKAVEKVVDRQNGLGFRILNSLWIVGLIIGLIPVVVPLIIFLAGFISSSVSGAAAAPMHATQNAQFSVQSSWPVLIQEDFSSNKRNWTTGTDNNSQALVQKDVFNGRYDWEIVAKKSIGSFSSPDMPAKKDVFVSVDLTMVTTSHSLQDAAGIIFRDSTQTGAFYFFGISSNGGYMLSMFDGNSWHDLIPATSSAVVKKTGQLNHLAVAISASQIVLEVNGQIVGSYSDTRLTSGDVGLGVNVTAGGITTTLSFTNFTVRTPQ